MIPLCANVCLRDAFLRYACLRDAYLRYGCLRFACLRYVYLRYGCLRDAVFALYCLRYGFLQNRLVTIEFWIDTFVISMIIFQLPSIEFCHTYTSISFFVKTSEHDLILNITRH